MQQEDYVKRQIDQLGQVLGRILFDLLGLKTGGQRSTGMEETFQALRSESNLDLDELLSIPPGDMIRIMADTPGLNHENLEKLSEILQACAGSVVAAENQKGKLLLERSLAILDYVDNTSTIYSFERHAKIGKIRQLLDSLEL